MSYTNNIMPVLRIQSDEKLVMNNDFKYRQITVMQIEKIVVLAGRAGYNIDWTKG